MVKFILMDSYFVQAEIITELFFGKKFSGIINES